MSTLLAVLVLVATAAFAVFVGRVIARWATRRVVADVSRAMAAANAPDDLMAVADAVADNRCQDCTRGCVGLVCPAADHEEPDATPSFAQRYQLVDEPGRHDIWPDAVAEPLAVDPPTSRPYITGGWVDLEGGGRVHRVCAGPGTPCAHCAPILTGSEVPR